MKVRALFVSFIFLASAIMVIFNGGQVGIAQISLLDDTPVLDESPVQDDYEFEVLSGEYAVVGVRPKVGNNNDLEIYTDNTFTTMIDSSNTAGDSVDFVSLYKDTWTGPPNRGAKVTSGSRDFVIEMENQIESHPVFDSWGESMDEMPGNPVLDVGISGSWDDEYVSHPTVIYANGLYRMWYSGNDDGSRYKIGYATSSDGKTWNKYGGNPVLDVGTSGQWDSYRAYSPTVLYIGGTYHMWYVGYNNVGFNFRIGYATSSDGITWAKSLSNPVLNLGSGGQWDDERVYAPCVLHDGITFQMWYSGYDGANYRIGYATSADGESWARHPSNPILGPGPATTWDDSRVFAPSVIFNGADYFMSYTGYDGGKYRAGYGVSQDGINWQKSPANPVLDLGQAGSWDDFQVHSPSILEDGSDTVLWYAGEDGLRTRIGYATLPVMDNWEKYSANPVLDIGTGGQWDDMFVRNPSILFDGTTYHMWYSGNGGPSWKIGYATSSDGINWNKYIGNPIMDVGSGWEDSGVLSPYVLFDGTTYHMWYSGDDGTTTRRIGYANSTDGINWNRYSGNPVINLGTSGMWDDDSVYATTVIYDGSIYHMWYHGIDSTSHRIGYATSPDGISWSKYAGNPIMDLGPPGSWDDYHVLDPFIVYDGSLYQMWYGGGDGSVLRIGYATSVDGINWQRYPGNPLIDIGPPGSFDDLRAYHHYVLFDGFTYHMWYTSHDGSTYRIGYASIPWKKLAPSAEVIDAFEITGFISGTEYSIDLNAPPTADLDMFIFDTPGGRNDALTSSINIGSGSDESITFTAPASGDYLLVITNEDGGFGSYSIIMVNDPPMITNVTALPNPQEVYGSVNISADITDEQQLFGVWVEIRNPLGNLIGNFSMIDIMGSDKFYLERTYNVLGQHTFTIWTNDTTDRWSTVSGTFMIQDTTPPLIIDVTAIPDPPEVYGNVNISADITDNYQISGVWVEVYDPISGFIGNFSMLYDITNDRYYWTQNYDLLGTFTYTIWANDTSNNWALAPGSFVIQDTTAPIISDIIAIPDPQEVFFSVNVSANITDNYQMDGAWVQIFDPDGILIGNFTMYENTIDFRYYNNRSYDTIGPYTFVIWANDTSNNWASAPGSFVIQDTTAPIISDITAIPDPQEVFFSVNISANITDNYRMGGAWIQIFDPDGILIGNFTMYNNTVDFRYYNNRSYDTIGLYTFTIWANDTSNNWASEIGTFIIQDTEPPVIADALATPDPQEVSGDVRISAEISDNFQLDGEWVEIYDSNDMFVGNFSMTYDPISDRFYHEQNYEILGQYTFTIWAKDLADNWASDYGTFVIHDTTPPIISDPAIIPDPQEVYGPINISASITDNYELFGGWIEIYNPDGNSMYNITLNYDLIFERYYLLENYNLLGIYTFTIWANDTSDNWASLSGVFTVQDTTKPLILDTTAVPDPQEVFGVVNISANVTDNYELSHVWFEVRNPEGNLEANGPMQYSTSDLKYYWNQSYDTLGTFSYIIRANDTSSNLASISGTFLIRDTTPPVISDIVIIYREPNLYKPINVSTNVTDNYQLHNVWIEIIDPDGHTIENTSMEYNPLRYRFYMKRTFNMSGEYTFKIHANDTSNNWATSSGEIRIEPEEEPEEYNWKPIIAFLFVIILLIIGIIIILSHPMKFTGDLGKDRLYSFFAGVLPFVVAEAITGIISFFTGLLAVPPILGLGMMVDLGIMIVGIISSIVIYVKGVPSESYKEEITPTPNEPQPPELTSQIDRLKTPPSSPESPSPSPSPETPPPLPVPEPDEEQPALPPPEPEKEPPPPPPF